MRKALSIACGAIATSILLSGCASSVQTIEKQIEIQSIKKPMINDIDANKSSVSVFALSNGYLVHGFSLDWKNVQKGIIESSSNENIKCIFGVEAKADLNRERFDIRLNSATCSAENNNTFVSNNIKGYVVGSDNRVGVKGIVVARQGGFLMQHFQNKISKVENVVSENNATTKVIFNEAILDSLILESGNFHSTVTVVATEGDFVKINRDGK